MIRPSGCNAAASTRSSPPKSTIACPPVPNDVSIVPFEPSRTAVKSVCVNALDVEPMTTIRPSGWTSTATARPPLAPQLMIDVPPLPNVESSEPLAFNLATAHCSTPETVVLPATTSLPSAWTATEKHASSPPKETWASPAVPKELSGAPLGSSRATAQFPGADAFAAV